MVPTGMQDRLLVRVRGGGSVDVDDLSQFLLVYFIFPFIPLSWKCVLILYHGPFSLLQCYISHLVKVRFLFSVVVSSSATSLGL